MDNFSGPLPGHWIVQKTPVIDLAAGNPSPSLGAGGTDFSIGYSMLADISPLYPSANFSFQVDIACGASPGGAGSASLAGYVFVQVYCDAPYGPQVKYSTTNTAPLSTFVPFNRDTAFHTFKFEVGLDGVSRWYRDGIQKLMSTNFSASQTLVPALSTSNVNFRVDNIMATRLGTPDVSFSVNDVSIAEGTSGTTAIFTVSLSEALTQSASVTYATVGGSATSGTDYTPVSGTLSFAPGVTTQTIAVPILGDTISEPDESFFVNLGSSVNAGIGRVQAAGTIVACTPGGAFDSDLDGIPDTVEATEGTNACTRDNDVFTSARLFAMQQYRDFLGREGDTGGIAYWTSMIGGGTSRATVTKSFFDSGEFQGAIAPVTRLYFAYFNRIPDKPGLDYWIAQYGAGTSLNTISQAFASSPEFVGTYGSLNNSDFVTLVYQNVLGRAPDGAGLAYWTGQLNGGFMTRGQVMVGFSESPEYQGSSYSRVFVTMVYYGMLRRMPDQAGFNYWVAQLAGGSSALNLINGFLAAPEYRGRFLP